MKIFNKIVVLIIILILYSLVMIRSSYAASLLQRQYTYSDTVINNKDSDTTSNHSKNNNPSKKKYERNYIPTIVFGFTGGLIGMVIGGKIKKPTHIEGEIPEIFNKQVVVGGIIGATIGSGIGFMLGKMEKTCTDCDSTSTDIQMSGSVP